MTTAMRSETPTNVPQHVAIIMDGNGRWANARGLPRTAGHRAGVERVREAVRTAAEADVKYLTLFAFSSENWNRPKQEVSDLMGLLRFFIRRDLAELHRENVRVRVIGCRKSIQPDIKALLVDAEERTRDNTGISLVIAFNYGARDEMVRAVREIAEAVRSGDMDPASITETTFAGLYRHRRDTRSGSGDPHQRRATAFQFPAVAGGLCGIRLHALPLAGFRSGRLSRGAERVWQAGPPLWRRGRT
jgi:undecaprenyl diphosphate synthase